MFVIENTVSAIKSYMFDKLNGYYSEREINYFFKNAVCNRLNLADNEFLLAANNRLSESDLLFFRNVVKRLQNSEPFQYIIGETWFYDLKFKCDKRALIPRPETEELVDLIVKENLKSIDLKVVDLCSGSGCISIALSKKLKNALVTGVEFSQDAIDLSRKNALLNHANVSFLYGNVLECLPTEIEDNSIDVLVSNPPYIPLKDKDNMEKNVLDFEPHLALFVADENPLIFYKKIADHAIIKLKKTGILYLEIHEKLAIETKQILVNKGFLNTLIIKDLQGKDRIIKASLK
jgi:release factor glutamine methyltransferase